MPSLTKENLTEFLSTLEIDKGNFNTFIETGSHIGQTISNMILHFEKLITIEVSEKYYNIVNNKFKNEKKVTCILGDSSIVLENILDKENENIIFWLDGHYSSGDTGKGLKDCPLIEELNIIDYKTKNSLIIIDDFRLFGTNQTEDWSTITYENIIQCFKHSKIKNILSKDDRLIILI